MTERGRWIVILLLGVALTSRIQAEDILTQYDLLVPESHEFAIRYDVSATNSGSSIYFNIIRPGSTVRDEKVFDRATGKEIKFEMSNGKEAKEQGQAEPDTADETPFIKAFLPHPVPVDGEFRIRILKTYKDAKSYFIDGDTIVFDRSLSIKRNVIILPAGYELIASTVPVMVSTESGGRIKVSLINDRDDEIAVKITGRRLKRAVK